LLDYPESIQKQESEAKNSWGAWLAEVKPWDWFVTMTFRDPKGVDYDRRGISYCRAAVANFIREARWYGGTRSKRPAVPVGVFAIERHARGSPHVHGLVLSPGRRMAMVDWGWEKYGITRVEAVESRGAAFYVTKYIMKGGPECLILDHLTPGA